MRDDAGVPGEEPKPIRVAFVQQGDPNRPDLWSGVSASLIGGLREVGCEVTPIDAGSRAATRVARRLGVDWARQSASRAHAAVASAAALRRLASAGPLDGIVMIGSGYRLRSSAPIVTFEDMTVAQAARRSDPAYEQLGERGVGRWIERQRRIYEFSRGCCVASRWAAASLRDDYGVPREKAHVVGMGNNIQVDPAPRDWSRPRFLFVGADWRRKCGDVVVEAFERVRERHPEAQLDLVGNHPQVDAEGVTGHGRLPLGSAEGRQRYAELLQGATCFLMPSLYEPFGIAYIDAAVAGVPSIGTTVGGAPDAVGDGGRLVEPGDAEALTAAMLELVDPATAQALGERARGRAGLLTWRAVAERLLRAMRPARLEVESMAAFLDDSPPPRGSR
jgi:glycosyltransferase involved in cell wall biosynthesis